MAKVAIEYPGRASWALQRAAPALFGLVWLLLVYIVGGDMLGWGVGAAVRHLLPLLAGAALSLLPGLAILQVLWPDEVVRWDEKLALSWCVSIALPPLLLQLAALVRLPWNTWTTWAFVAASAVVVLWSSRRSWQRVQKLEPLRPLPVLLFCLTLLALLIRLYIVRELPVGLWGDSYHHTMIAQLLVDNNGMFTSWEPYAPLATFTYHYGFHANAAFFHWVTGVPVTRSVVVVGQLINVAALAGMYVLTTRFTKSRAAGLWALALTGFLNTQPTYYVNWGRYTQLTGQVILVVVLISWQAVLEHRAWNWRRILFATVVTACLMLTHYIVTIFAALFLAAYVIALVLRQPSQREFVAVVGRSAVVAVLAVLLALPWLITTLTGLLGRNLGGAVNQSASAAATNPDATLHAINPVYLSTALLLLAGVGTMVALARRDWRTTLFAVWSQLLILSIVPHIVGLPGTAVISQFTAYIALYLTAIPLAAYVIGLGQEAIERRSRTIGQGLAALALVSLSLWAIPGQQRLIDPFFQLFTPADEQAMEWIRTSTPLDAKFVVNAIPAYGDSVFAGTDGGWWIPLLTGRETNVPPITYGSERAITPDFAERVNAFGFALREHPLPSDEALDLCREQNIRYVYSGAHIGQEDRFDVGALREHPAFKVVYDRDGVTIFELVQAPTAP